jgi:hypothetical protein
MRHVGGTDTERRAPGLQSRQAVELVPTGLNGDRNHDRLQANPIRDRKANVYSGAGPSAGKGSPDRSVGAYALVTWNENALLVITFPFESVTVTLTWNVPVGPANTQMNDTSVASALQPAGRLCQAYV